MSLTRFGGQSAANAATRCAIAGDGAGLHTEAPRRPIGTHLARSRCVRTTSMPRRVIGDLAISAGGLLILVFAIAAFDYRVREHVATAGDVAGLGHQVSSLAILVAMVVVQFT